MVQTAAPAPRQWKRVFLSLLPAIVAHARFAFRHLRGEARQDAVQEVIANSLVAFIALARRGKLELVYPTVLAKYAVAQINEGRRVGNRLSIRDVLSRYCQVNKHVTVERLDQFDEKDNEWKEAVVQDTRSAPVPDIVAFRCDFADWLKSLKRRDRRLAQYLSLGNRTRDAAKEFGVSEGRVSQLRSELAASWNAFTGDNRRNAVPVAA
jgi:hypothetical protein